MSRTPDSEEVQLFLHLLECLAHTGQEVQIDPSGIEGTPRYPAGYIENMINSLNQGMPGLNFKVRSAPTPETKESKDENNASGHGADN